MKKGWVIAIVAVALLVVSALAAGFLMQGEGDDQGGDGWSIPLRDDTRTFCRSFGGLGGYETGQLFDATWFAFGWTDSGQSEKVGVLGAVTECQTITTATAKWIRYIFYISTPKSSDSSGGTPRVLSDSGGGSKYDGEKDSRKWDLFRFPSDAGDYNEGEWRYDCQPRDTMQIRCNPSGWGAKKVLASPLPFKVEGRHYKNAAGEDRYIYDGSVLRVELQMVTGGSVDNPTEGNWVLLAVDEARLRSMLPDVEWGQKSYKVGDVATLNYDLPWLTVDDQPAYYFSILNLNVNSAVKSDKGLLMLRVPITDIATNGMLTGQIRVPVTQDMFADVEPCTNALEARVYSPILKVDETSTSVLPRTVLSPGARPTVKSFTFDKKQYNKGDSATVTVEATGNVTKWTLQAQIEGTEALPLTTYREPTNKISKTFVLPTAGLLEVEARAYTVCLPSDTEEIRIDVGREFGPYCLRNPTDPLCKPPPEVPWDLILAVALVLGFVAGLFTYVGIGHREKWYIKLVAAVLVGALVGVVMYYVALAVASMLSKVIPWAVLA